jgi:hypothetical protein
MGKITPLKRNTLRESVEFGCGTITAVAEGKYHVLTEYGAVLSAQKAEGCLIMPEPGDRVLMALETNDDVFILNVLTKKNSETKIAIPGKVVIEGDEISLRGSKSASLEAPEVKLSGVYGEVSFAGFSFIASWCETRVKKAVVAAHKLDSVIDTLTERIRNSFRHIEGMEQTTAKRVRTIVKERFFLKARHTAVIAEEEVSVDGKQIHIG